MSKIGFTFEEFDEAVLQKYRNQNMEMVMKLLNSEHIGFLPKIKKVEFHNNVATVVYWDDNTVTRVEVGEKDVFSEEYGFAMAVAKKALGSYDRFAWSLSKAKRYVNGKKITKNKE